ncbi:HypC/HybG/HupF family hydrogenase formation chaperone [Stygiolobus caldivivus]|uniref:HypC/HybG/HupF family hydrogenase formation chaperone n=1 Tax=Stygiolobus caldivivus TaxID=2824673 RepID=A0A8D5U483_9CREN|nr:HypC/HybG/HupF family hydrogenase formation chaperone [Stygiolobus caldivivus]BCU68813.1 hypothetical protein KN1_01100 [Stygiolobus caldivivus]
MCISIPAKVVQVGDMIALVDFGNGEPTPALNNAEDEIKEGDYVLVSYGMIIQKISEREYLELLSYERQMRELALTSSLEQGKKG